MDRSLRVRTFILAGLLALCVGYLLPTFVSQKSLPSWYFFDKKIKLGLDLQGGVRAVYTIDLDKAVDDKAAEVKRDLDTKLEDRKIAGKVTTPGGVVRGAITVALTDPAKKAEVEKMMFSEHAGEIQRRTCPGTPEDTANQICVRISSKFADEIKRSALTQAVATVKKRVDEKGVTEPNVIRQDQKIIVELPGIGPEAREEVKELIARTAKLEFKIVDNDNPYMRKLFSRVGTRDISTDLEAAQRGISAVADSWTNDKSGNVFNDYYLKAYDRKESTPVAEAKKSGCYRKDIDGGTGSVMCNVSGRKLIEQYIATLAAQGTEWVVPDNNVFGFEEVFPTEGDDDDKRSYWRSYLLERAVRLTGTAISKAQVTYDQNTLRPEVIIHFNRYGGRVFGQMTGENVGKKMAIILDETVESAPVIQTKIAGGVSTITMGGADPESVEKEANDLVNVLRTGALPAPLQEESLAELGPTLGRDAVSKAQLSFALGSLLVIAMMLGIYRWSGLIAVSGIVINLLLQLTVMAAFNATLTLPGIAALVLTVGLDVDGNILIYERIRDELQLGKSVRGAVDIGFQRAFTSILDGHMTTAAAGWVLLQYGTGPIHGFAVLLLVGIGTTLFVNTWVTRLLFDWYIARKRGELATISI